MDAELALSKHVGRPPMARAAAWAGTAEGRGSCRSSAFEMYMARHCEIVLTHRGHRSPSPSVPLQVAPEQAALVQAMLPVLSPPSSQPRDE
jgi:hypothetical protein